MDSFNSNNISDINKICSRAAIFKGQLRLSDSLTQLHFVHVFRESLRNFHPKMNLSSIIARVAQLLKTTASQNRKIIKEELQ